MTVPHDTRMEAAVLGGLIVNPDMMLEVEQILPAAAFYVPKHKWIYEAMQSLHVRGEPIDVLTLADELAKYELHDYLVELITVTPSSMHVMEYAESVKDRYMRRRYIDAASEVAKAAYTLDQDVAAIQTTAETLLLDISMDKLTREKPLSQDLLELLFETDKRVEAGGGITGLSTGFADLDRITSGFEPGELILIAARPGMGKSILESCISLNMAQMGHRVLRINLEMSPLALTRRMVSHHANIPHEHIQRGKFESDQERYLFSEAVGELSMLPMQIESPGTCTPEWVASYARKKAMTSGLDVLTIDYLQLMTVIAGYNNKVQEVALISSALKGVARELGIPVIALAQLNRSVESRMNKRPTLSDLRDSGALEQDADKVVFIYREDYYLDGYEQGSQTNVAELIVAKNRNGAVGTVKMYFSGRMMTFKNLQKQVEVPF